MAGWVELPIMDTIYENRFAIQNPVQKIVPVNLSLCVGQCYKCDGGKTGSSVTRKHVRKTLALCDLIFIDTQFAYFQCQYLMFGGRWYALTCVTPGVNAWGHKVPPEVRYGCEN